MPSAASAIITAAAGASVSYGSSPETLAMDAERVVDRLLRPPPRRESSSGPSACRSSGWLC